MEQDKKFILQKTITIPAGTEFTNYSNEAKKGGYYDTVIGIGKNCVEFFRIYDMEDILINEPDYFKEAEQHK